jgi:hypothetical protein
MNSLTKALIEGLIDENESFNGKIVGMFGGGFKPPTIGHLEVVQKALSDYPEMDELIVLVGSGVRDSISQEESLAIWDIYKKSLPSKVKIMASPKNKPPIGAIYSYAKKNPNERIYWFLGEREGNEGDAEDIVKRTKSLRKLAYQNVKVKKIVTGGAVSGTKARQAVLNKDKEAFLQYIPDIPETDEIWDMLTDVVKEYKHKYDKEELRKGIEVEKEHTDDPKIALKIALDHLDEDPQYYTKLATLGLEEQFLQERIAYDAETRMQTRFLMKQFLKTVGTKIEDSTEGTLVGDEYELVYGFYPMKKGLGFMPFKIEGSAGPKDIAIAIKYNPELLDKKLYSELSAELRNSVRHELEHLAQYRAEKGVRPGEDGVNQDDLPDVEYLTLDYEIPGHIQGLRTKAKAKKISLQQAINDLFNSFEYDLDPEEEDFVRETWMNWLKTNMPGVSLTKIKEEQLDEGVDLINDLINSGVLDWLIEWIYSDRFKYLDIESQRFIAQLENETWRKEFSDSKAFKEFRKILGASILYSRLQLLFQKGFPLGNKEKTLQTFEKLKNHPVIGRIGKAIINTIAGTPLAAEVAADSFKKGYSEFFNMMEKAQFIKILDNMPNKIKEKLRQQSDEILKNTQLSEVVAHEMGSEDWNNVGNALRDPKKAKAIYGFLLQMFPKQKEVIDYNYKNDAFAEMKRVIHGIDKYKLIGPITVQPKEMKLEPEVEAEREKKFQQFVKGEIDKYFRTDKTDPRKVDVSKFPPITMDEEGFVSDGNHRAFIAKKQNKPLKAYRYIAAKNDHPNVAKILKLVGRSLEENIDQQDVEDLDNLADRELNPIDVVLTGKHFFDRLNDPRNRPEIDYLELEDFFTKLGDNREEFINFLNKYKSVVATDNETNINIPFMKMANKAIAKTIMRKRNFQTPNAKVELEEANPKKGTGYKELEEEFKPYLTPLTDYMAQELNLSPYPSIEYVENDKENEANIFGKTAYYMPNEKKIVLFTLGRHPKDILRSYAHELIHHHQNLSDTLNHNNTTNTNEDGALEDIEREAYETGNILFRKWEDSLKNN